MSKEYKPWKNPNQKIDQTLPKRKTIDATEGLNALKGIREKMGGVLKKDQALKISMYTTENVKRKEGDKWTDANGKMWERKNGINQSISKLRGAKTPWWCPKCEKAMNTKLDTKFYYKREMCYDCVVKLETEMRLNGTWQAYQRKIMYDNMMGQVNDAIAELKSYQESVSNPQIHFQDGTFEEWDVDVDQLKMDLQEEIDKLEDRAKELQNEASRNMVKLQQNG